MSTSLWLVNLGYAVVAVSFLVRDIVYLRTIAVLAGILLTIASIGTGDPWPAFWNALFTLINLAWLARLYLLERRVQLNGEELRLYETTFAALGSAECLRLLRAGRWVDGAAGELLTKQGETTGALMLISHGSAMVEANGEPLAELCDGQWVGEMSFVTQQPASANVRLTQATRYLSWSRERLTGLFQREPSLKLVLMQVVSGELSRKLRVRAGEPS
ncbi:MAG TPA: cyclic nucleotide-binding domain-containing protein [Solimonas sp.]|nr:cyclic nucleotide-binding domain-containing protein [Solimonas sp.]